MAASVVTMGVGLVTSLSSFEGTGTGTTGGGKDEIEDIRTFNTGTVLYFATTVNSSGVTSYEAGAGVSMPTQYGQVGASGSGTNIVSGAGTTTSIIYETVEQDRTLYHRWACKSSFGECLNNGAGSEWRLLSDPLPPKEGWWD